MTLAQSYLSQTLDQQKQTQHYMAQQVATSQSTISRELAKHSDQHPQQRYDAQQAQHRAATVQKRAPYKLKGSLLTTVLTRIRDRLSPEQICGELQRMATQKVLHHETIYRSGGPALYLSTSAPIEQTRY